MGKGIDRGLRRPVPLLKNSGRPPDPNRKRPVAIKHCRRHGLTEFAQYSAGPKRGYRWSCKRCVGEAVTRRKQKLKRLLVEENGGCCAVCGYDRCIINLVFHHVDPAQKSFGINMGKGRSIATFREAPSIVTAGEYGQPKFCLPLVPKVAALGEDHRDAGRVAGLDHLGVAL
jgi:hypothetical protein